MSYTEECIESVTVLVKNNIPEPVIICLLRMRGFTLDKSLTIVRWAKMKVITEYNVIEKNNDDEVITNT
jgi:hypothetical protein